MSEKLVDKGRKVGDGIEVMYCRNNIISGGLVKTL